jgi:hypothetical protein
VIYGILIGFYPEYQRKAINKFCKLIAASNSDHKIIYVNNNPFPPSQKIPGVDLLLPGDNRVWEFSGWDVALHHLRENSKIGSDDTFVFANDTFCHHHFFTTIDRLAFHATIQRHKSERTPWIIGEINGSGIPFSILDMPFSFWASTYLFAANVAFLNAIDWRVALKESELSSVINGIVDDKIIWGEKISCELQIYLQEWLFPTHPNTGWYKAKDNSLKIGKIRAILNEKYLSARLFCAGGAIKPIYNSPLLKLYFRAKHKLFRSIKA